MSNRFFKRLIWCLSLWVGGTTSFAQNTVINTHLADREKFYYSLERLEWLNPWIKSDNGAGIGLHASDIPNFQGFSDLAVAYATEQGKLRLPQIANTKNRLTMGTSTFQKIDNTFVLANFHYIRSLDKKAQWNGLNEADSSPFMLSDSIPANISREIFNAGFSLSHPLHKHFFAGLYTDYTISKSAKVRDLRFISNYNVFYLMPSLAYRHKKFNLGLNAGIKHVAEDIVFSQIETNVIRRLFEVRGLWFMREYLYASTGGPRERTMDDKSLLGNIQFEYKGRKNTFFNSVGFVSRHSKQYKGNERFGNTEDLTVNYSGLFRFNRRLAIDLHSGYLMRDGINIIQQTKIIDGSTQIITIGSEKSYLQKTFNSGIALTYRKVEGLFKENWRFTLDGNMQINHRNYFRYPINATQDLNTFSVNTSFARFFYFSQSSLELKPKAGFSFGNGDLLSGSGYTTSDYLAKPLNAEFQYYIASRYSAGLTADFNRQIDLRFRWFINTALLYQKSINKEFRNDYRFSIQIASGIRF